MAFDYDDSFRRIVAKAHVLAQKYAVALQKKNEAEAQAKEFASQLEQKEKELEKLKVEIEYLRTAAVLAPSREQVESTRKAIASLVRDIDRCIIDLSE